MYLKSRNNPVLSLTVIFFLVFCGSKAETTPKPNAEQQSTTQEFPRTFLAAVDVWKKNGCVYPDASLYTTSNSNDDSPILAQCGDVEKKTQLSLTDKFTLQMCRVIYFVTDAFCGHNKFPDFAPSLKKSVLDNVLDSSRDVCDYVTVLSKHNKTSVSFLHAMLEFKLDEYCDNYCQGAKLKPLCQLVVSGMYQYFTVQKKVNFGLTPGQRLPTPKAPVTVSNKDQNNTVTQAPPNVGSNGGSTEQPTSKDQSPQPTVLSNNKTIQPNPNNVTTKNRPLVPASTPAVSGTTKDKVKQQESGQNVTVSTVSPQGMQPHNPAKTDPFNAVSPLKPSGPLGQGTPSGQTQEQKQTTKKPVSAEEPQAPAITAAPIDSKDENPPTQVFNDKVTNQPPFDTVTSRPQQTANTNVDGQEGNTGTDHALDETYVDFQSGRRKPEQDGIQTKKTPTFQTVEDNVPGSGHFFAYFLTAVVICISGYVIFHNKQKILAFIVEGRSEAGRRRNGGSVQYKPLQSNVEEVMPSLDKATSAKNFVY